MSDNGNIENMAVKTLKTAKRKVTPKRAVPEAAKKFVLVGTYQDGQLKAWPGYYNYPIFKDDKIDVEACKRVNEIWLFNGTKAGRYFAAEFVGVKTREELKADFGYPAKGKGHGDGSCLLYRISKTEIYDPATGLAEQVIVRAKDFARRSPRIAKQLKAYLESPDRKDPTLKSLVPAILVKLPREVLRVCEAAVRLDFMRIMFPNDDDDVRRTCSMDYICKAIGCRHGVPGWPDEFGNALRVFFYSNTTRRVRTLSLFSGAGGLDIGFSDAGFDIIGSVEIEKKFCATLELNSGTGKRFSHSHVNCIDIREFSGAGLGDVDFVIGGPPCQTFSAAGRRANGVLGTTDARGVLFREYVRLLGELKPKGFLFENVYGITGAQGGQAWREIKESFANAGYKIFARILDAADYGVPQHRERLFIVGLRDGEYKFPRPTHGPDSLNLTPFYNAGTAISGLQLSDEERKPGLGGRFGCLLNDIPPGLNYSFYTKEMGHPNPVFAWRSKFSDFLYKADPDAPVRTIKAQGGAYTGPLHWENRFFSYSEYKRLQTFPDDYVISGGKQIAVKQIGNSVPPQLARMLALSIQDQVFGVTFPFNLTYLNLDDKLSFRGRKQGVMERYRQKAKREISELPKKVELAAKDFETNFFCRISEKFRFDKCEPTEGAFAVSVKCGKYLVVSVDDLATRDRRTERILIEICPNNLSWNLPFEKMVLKSSSRKDISFTVAWKALEYVLATNGAKADLVQLNGYYQYTPELSCKCKILPNFVYSQIVSGIVSGENIRRMISEEDLARSWGVRIDEVVTVAMVLRGLGYEVRNHNTNPQIKKGQWLIPYAFPTLNHKSVQLGKEIA